MGDAFSQKDAWQVLAIKRLVYRKISISISLLCEIRDVDLHQRLVGL